MRILVDADACPGKDIIKEIAKQNNIEVHMFVDTSHFFFDDFFDIHVVSKGKDAVDMVLINFMDKDDIVITQDYGLAAMALPKTKHVLNPAGFLYTDKNMEELLFKRHISSVARRSGRPTSKIKKRSKNNDIKLKNILLSIIIK